MDVSPDFAWSHRTRSRCNREYDATRATSFRNHEVYAYHASRRVHRSINGNDDFRYVLYKGDTEIPFPPSFTVILEDPLYPFGLDLGPSTPGHRT